MPLVDETRLLAGQHDRRSDGGRGSRIGEFDSSKGGQRGIESLLYIAEVISAFDIVAVQEVRENLAPLNRLLDLLGSWWHVLVTDVTRGQQGNFERLAFLYDTRKVNFGGLVGEVVRPRSKEDVPGTFVEQFASIPGGLPGGWLKFTICTAHILYGTQNALDPRRIKEIGWLASMLADQHLEQQAWSGNVILLGDFNVFDTTDAIALDHAGVFPWDTYVYRASDAATYAKDRGTSKLAYPTWRTYQMSDHLPMWIELRTDRSEEYLKGLAQAAAVSPTSEVAPTIPLTHVG